jgi:hypothetical protein
MKKTNGTLTIIFGFYLSAFYATAQENLLSDPLLNFKNFYEIGISVNATRVNTNHTAFNTSNGEYNFLKNNYLITSDASFNYGWLFQEKESKLISTLKTGVNILSRNADLTDSTGTNLRLGTVYLQIPVQFGFRSPLKYNTVKNNLYRALECNAGFYTATPIMQKLDHSDNLDARGKSLPTNYFKFGFIGEIVFTALDNKGNGHKFGLRVSTDYTTILKIKDTPNQLYPYHYSIGLFYNILNRYK